MYLLQLKEGGKGIENVVVKREEKGANIKRVTTSREKAALTNECCNYNRQGGKAPTPNLQRTRNVVSLAWRDGNIDNPLAWSCSDASYHSSYGIANRPK